MGRVIRRVCYAPTAAHDDADTGVAKLPLEIYKTGDPESFKTFISECDIIVASLPNTRHTTGLLDAEKLCRCLCSKRTSYSRNTAWMKPHGVLVNVGRGSLIRSGKSHPVSYTTALIPHRRDTESPRRARRPMGRSTRRDRPRTPTGRPPALDASKGDHHAASLWRACRRGKDVDRHLSGEPREIETRGETL
jgi:hypothetical protein